MNATVSPPLGAGARGRGRYEKNATSFTRATPRAATRDAFHSDRPLPLAPAPRGGGTDGAIIEISGYASLFGIADAIGDIVRQGAFRATLARRTEPLPMLVNHEMRARAGVWIEAREDGRGLFVRGEIRAEEPAASRARRMLARGVDGLSIGFVPLIASKRANGRVLEEIDLLEVSIVSLPMQPLARLTPRAGAHRAA